MARQGTRRAGRRPSAGGAPAGGAPAGRGSRTARAYPARRAACDVLLAVARRGAYANLLLPSMLRERQITGRDAALATELCYGTLRGQGTYDAILNICSDRPVSRMDPPVRETLRLGTHQLLATRIAAHAAVATSVDLARDLAGARPAGFVNAVLRRVATRDLDAWMTVAAPDRHADPIGYLAIRHSYPRWIVAAFAGALAEAPSGALVETGAALAAGNLGPQVTLCAIPGACEPGELLAATAAEPARWSPFGVYLAAGDPAAIRAVNERRATVQDEASQLAALALARVEVTGRDRLWLDMCAGPGGKAALLAGLAAGRGARLLAADIRERRASLARDIMAASARAAPSASAPARPAEAADGPGTTAAGPAKTASSPAGPAGGEFASPGRTAASSVKTAISSIGPAAWGVITPGVTGAGSGESAGSPAGLAGGKVASPGVTEGEAGQADDPAGAEASAVAAVVVADGTVPAWQRAAFDRVLVDVPCSGLGSLRRRPESRWRRSAGQVAELGALQRSLLARALDSVRPGGVVGYVTCSPHLAETREVLADVLRDRQDVSVLDAPALLPEVPGLAGPAPYGSYVQFWPHRHGTDGIFLAVLRRLP